MEKKTDTLEVAKRLAAQHERAVELGRLLLKKNLTAREAAQKARLALVGKA